MEPKPTDSAAVDVTVFANGQPLPGADVDGRYWISSMKVGTVSGRTDREGKVRLALPPGDCSLQVRATGFAVDSWKVKSPCDKRIDLEPAGRISLRVTTEDGQPVTKASIQAYGKPGAGPTCTVTSESEPGIYVLVGLPKHPYRVLVMCHLLQGARLDGVVPGESTRDVVLRKGSRVCGRVVDGSGKGVMRACVTATEEAGLFLHGWADDEGRFELQGVGEGKIAVRASGPRLLSRSVEGVKAGAEDVLIQLDRGGDIEIRFGGDDLPTEVEIDIQRRSEIDGSWAFRGHFERTVEDGRVNLGNMGGLAWGNYELEVASEGFEAENLAHVIVSPEAPISIVNLVLRRIKTAS